MPGLAQVTPGRIKKLGQYEITSWPKDAVDKENNRLHLYTMVVLFYSTGFYRG